MRILFIGCVESSRRLLIRLLEERKEVAGVITKDKSEFNADFFDLKPICDEYNIPCIYVSNVNEEKSIEFICRVSADIGFCFGWSQLLKERVIDLFPKGVVGFHPAALPKNRGRHPLIWALALGLKETASTFFMISPGADEGDIISQVKLKINYEDDAKSLYDKVMNIAVEQEVQITNDFETANIVMKKQKLLNGNVWRKRDKQDGQIDWRMSSRSIYNLVRSLTTPYVGAHFIYQDKEYKVWCVKEIDVIGMNHIEPGKVLKVDNGFIDIKTGEGGIRMIKYDKIDLKEGEYIL